MTSNIRISSVEISFHFHSTENQERGLDQIMQQLGLDKHVFSTTKLEGHFGNIITRIIFHLTGEKANIWLIGFLKKIRKIDRITLFNNIHDHIDEHGKLYLRLSKQSLFRKFIEFGNLDIIRIKIKPKTKQGIALIPKYYREMF